MHCTFFLPFFCVKDGQKFRISCQNFVVLIFSFIFFFFKLFISFFNFIILFSKFVKSTLLAIEFVDKIVIDWEIWIVVKMTLIFTAKNRLIILKCRLHEEYRT